MLEAKQKTLSAKPFIELFGDFASDVFTSWILPSRTMKRRLWPLAIGFAYILIIGILGGLRADHVLLGLLPLLDSYNEKTRRFLGYFTPFILTGAVYDSMRYFYWQGVTGHIQVSEPYYRDLHWFGIQDAGIRVTPNEYFATHPLILLDLLCGFAYLVFVGEYLLAAFYLFFKERFELLKLFGMAFFTVNIFGFMTYFIYPAAPPWYVKQFGMGPARLDIHPTAAAANRFDQILGTHFFDQIYGRGIDVYGAYPSLHVAYPLLVVWVTFQLRELRWARIPAIGFYLLMCLSAVYLQHHYIVDILLGSAYAIGTVAILKRMLRPSEKSLKI
jgi:membrane-associated phospholipid phosphatase